MEILKKKKKKEPKVTHKIYQECELCPQDMNGNKLDCSHCGNTRKKLIAWIEEA